MVYLRVRQVRSGVKAMEASLTTANPDSIISIPKSADISGPSTGELPPRSHTKVDKVEQEVFRMSVAILLVMIVCWTPILIVFVTKLIIQEEIPMWAEFISISTALLDVSFLTPTILIRFNRHYRKLWFEHVLKFEFLKRSWIVKLIFGVPPN